MNEGSKQNMARWDDESFGITLPPKDILCASCKYRAKPVILGDSVVDRSGYAMCEKYELKPHGVLWKKESCPDYDPEKQG